MPAKTIREASPDPESVALNVWIDAATARNHAAFSLASAVSKWAVDNGFTMSDFLCCKVAEFDALQARTVAAQASWTAACAEARA